MMTEFLFLSELFL